MTPIDSDISKVTILFQLQLSADHFKAISTCLTFPFKNFRSFDIQEVSLALTAHFPEILI